MGWHVIPKDDAWKRVTLAHVASLGQRLWLRCDGCGRDFLVGVHEFSTDKGVALDTPLLAVSLRLVCTRCGAKKGHCWPEPHSMGQNRSNSH